MCRLRHRAGCHPRRGGERQARHVWVDETRPVLQGARLTAWELDRLGIDATLVADVAAALLMAVARSTRRRRRRPHRGERRRREQVGTYRLAVLARHHGIPFYVAAPRRRSTSAPRRRDIAIEERDADEVAQFGGSLSRPRFARAQPGVRRHAGAPRERRSSPRSASRAALRPLAPQPRPAGGGTRAGAFGVAVTASP